jgi:two-component system sensor histidine kinase PilS (NtrC family)
MTTSPGNEPIGLANLRAFAIFLIYRLLLATGLPLLALSGKGPVALASESRQLFLFTALFYLAFNLVSLFLIWRSRADCQQQIQFAVFSDIAAIALFTHASGGVTSGLALFQIISITVGSLLLDGRSSLVFASIAAAATLTSQFYGFIEQGFPIQSFAHASLLGASLMTVSLLGHFLSRRLRETERLAEKTFVDLENLEQLNSYIIAHMNTGVLVLNPQLHVHAANEQARRLLDRPLPKGTPLARETPDLAALIVDHPPANEAKIVREADRELRITIQPLTLGEGSGTLCFIEDNLQFNRQAQHLKLASLGRLTAGIAHEIRNPLAAISHAGQLLGESPHLDASDQQLLQIVHNNSQRVNQIVESIMQLSRRRPAQAQPIALARWIDQLVQDFSREQNADLRQQIDRSIEPADLILLADADQLRQILLNLLHNALQHSGREAAELRVLISAQGPPLTDPPQIAVSDNGKGIASDHLQQLFEPFFTTAHFGTGLGLFVCRELAEINGIRIQYQAAGPLSGGRFLLTFPKSMSEPTIP